MHLPCDPPVECRRVDHNGDIRFALVGVFNEAPEKLVNPEEMAGDLRYSNDCEIAGIYHRLTSSGPHTFPAYAEELQLRSRHPAA
jgi:hypothetical protein